MDLRVHLKKNKSVHTSLAVLGCCQWVIAWIETDALSFGWDLHSVLLLVATGRVLMEENFNRTARRSSWQNTEFPLEGEKRVSSLAFGEAPYILCQCLLVRKPANHSGQICSTLSCRICCCHTLQTHSPQAAIAIGIVATQQPALTNFFLFPDTLMQLSLFCSTVVLHKKPQRSPNPLKLASGRVVWR